MLIQIINVGIKEFKEIRRRQIDKEKGGREREEMRKRKKETKRNE